MATKMVGFHNMSKLGDNSMSEARQELIISNLISSLYTHQKYNFLNHWMNSNYGFAQAGQKDCWIHLQ
jgi:hypothetical protein